MGWKSAVRSLNKTAREIDRAARRRAAEERRALAAMAKQQSLEHAEEMLVQFESYVQGLTTVHRVSAAPIDWAERAAQDPPDPPVRSTRRATSARQRLASYSPGLMARMLGRVELERGELRAALEDAIADDEAEYQSRAAAYEDACRAHADEVELAGLILRRDPEAMREYLEAANPFDQIAEVGDSVRIAFHDSSRVAVTVNVHGPELVPEAIPRRLASGRVSLKAMPKADYHRLYQDYVCSVALRVVREMYAALPLDTVLVTAVDDFVDPMTGHVREQPIVTLIAERSIVEGVNFDGIDPSEAIRNFKHRMDFKDSRGFRFVTALSLDSTRTV